MKDDVVDRVLGGIGAFKDALEDNVTLDEAEERFAAIPDYMKCPQCSKQLVGVEYPGDHPDHYDGVSEWACFPCGYHRGRWSGKLLGDGESEPRWGVRREVFPA